MDRVLLAGLLLVGAVAVALVLRRRQTDEPVRTSWAVPDWLDRTEFSEPASPWLVAVFTSATCRSCQEALAEVQRLAGEDVAVEEVDVETRPELHERYGIEAVPTVVIADAEGAVRGSFIGPPTAVELRDRVAEARRADAAEG